MRRILLLAALIAASLLSGCGGNPATTQYRQNPHGFMRQVVECENNFAAIGQTPRCQRVLRLNASLF